MNGKNFLWFIIGTAVGAGGATLICQRFYKKKAAAEVQEMREYMRSKGVYDEHRKRYSGEDEVDDEHPPVIKERDATEEEMAQIDAFNAARGNPRMKTDYTKFKENPMSPEELAEIADQYAAEDFLTEEEKAEREHPRDSHEDDIYIISEREFLDEHVTDYGKVELTYYMHDESLCDDYEELLPDWRNLIGPNALQSFGHENDDPDVVYVRNNRLANDYKITRIHGAYHELVLGILPDIDVDPDTLEARRRMND